MRCGIRKEPCQKCSHKLVATPAEQLRLQVAAITSPQWSGKGARGSVAESVKGACVMIVGNAVIVEIRQNLGAQG